MNKRKLSWLSALIVVLSFCIVVGGSGGVFFISGAEDNDPPQQQTTAGKTHSPEEPYEPTTTTTKSTTTTTTKPTTTTTTTASTTKPTTESTTEKKTTAPGDGTTKNDTSSSSTSTTKQDSSEPQNDTSEPHQGTTSGSNPSTTKKNNPATTKKNNTTRYTNAPAAPVTKITIPEVGNTEVDGSTLSPLDAYFERLSGDSAVNEDVLTSESVAAADTEEEDNGNSLGMGAIIAICLGGVAAVTCGITAVLAIKNKKTSKGGAVEYDDEYESYDYAPDDPNTYNATPNVDQTAGFTVVSLDDTDYTE